MAFRAKLALSKSTRKCLNTTIAVESNMNAENDNQNRWRKLKDVFNEAVELTPESRASYLAALRRDEETLYQELAELIDIDREAEDFLGEPISLKSDFFSSSPVGETVGNYRIVREIERGGMGMVFEAVRFDGEFEQRVAVKLVNRHFLSDELIKRFKKERQIHAKLEHSNIVRLLDGGFTNDKTPYYVMEFIEGTPINVYCRENNLDTDQRLNLFLQVCEAVAYAHRQLIVHRDLKPSNILVTKNEQVKLLDFGIAKILEADTDAQTQTQNAPLTPAYSSPEQIKGETITTASDVFSLGAILYELLTGKSPHEIYGVGRMEILRGICEVEPVAPSRTVKDELQITNYELQNEENQSQTNTDKPGFQSKDQRPKTEDQKSNPKSKIQNPKSLKGDLDNIVLKALRKEKERRYNSVEQFAEDIKSYLKGLPVKAHPQSFKYRASKFIKRNRWLVGFGTAAVLLIAIGVGVAIWQFFVAQHERQIAEQRFDQVRKIANSLILNYHDEIAKLEGSTKLRENLVVDAVNYLDVVSREETENPELLKESAIAYRKIGDVQGKPYHANLGKLDEALVNYQKSVNLLEKAITLTPSDISLKDELLKSYDALALARNRLDAPLESEAIIRKAIALGEEVSASDDNLDRKILLLQMRATLGDVQGKTIDKYDIYKQALAKTQTLYQSNQSDVRLTKLLDTFNQRFGTLLVWLGEAEMLKGNTEAADDYYRQSLEYHRQQLYYEEILIPLGFYGQTNRRPLADAYSNVAASLIKLRRYDEALKNVETAISLIQNMQRNDPDNRELILDEVVARNNKQKIFTAQGEFDSALKEIETALDLAEDLYRRDQSNFEPISWIGNLAADAARLSHNQKKEKEAEKYRQIFFDYEKQYKEKFGRDWRLKL